MEIQWGHPMTLVTSHDGNIERFGTIEKARYWLHKRWPVSDNLQHKAIAQIESAMNCMTSVEDARRAFASAALSAGLNPVLSN